MTASATERALREAAPGVPTSSDEADRTSYARDLWPRHHVAVRDGEVARHKPQAIVWPRSSEEVARIVERCAREGIPIVPFGAGSGVCGGVLPDAETVVIDMKRLAHFEIHEGDGPSLEVGAGAMGIRLEEDLQARGYTLGHFPSSILCSTVGGWVAARSAGQCSGLYGKIEDMVASLELVHGRGEVLRLHRRIHGPDGTPLIVGSEGVLGIVTSARLRLHPKPEARSFAAWSFVSAEAGFDAMRTLYQSGLRPAVCRLYDPFDSWMAKRGAVRGARKDAAKQASSPHKKELERLLLRSALRLPSFLNGVVERLGDRAFGGAMLVLVFEGREAESLADRARAAELLRPLGGSDLGEGPAEHWLAHRYGVSYRQAPVFMSGAFSDTMEVAAPWSRLEGLYHGVRRAMRGRVFVMAHLSHAYPDGCSIYFTFAGSAPTREATEALYDATWRDALAAVLDAGGTVSHHHGVGRSKAPALGEELGRGVDVVHALRRALDPAGVFNPGNLLPRSGTSRSRRTSAARVPPADTPSFDEASSLVHAHGETKLGRIESAARARGLSLRIRDLDGESTVADFLAQGAVGAIDPWDDPVDHLVAGFVASLPDGDELVVRPGPRRAVGPDLYALFHGMRERVGRIRSAHLRLHRVGLDARKLPCSLERDPSLGGLESAWFDRVVDELRRS
jgi:alkyldihydroxyacetonephosphate synthase